MSRKGQLCLFLTIPPEPAHSRPLCRMAHSLLPRPPFRFQSCIRAVPVFVPQVCFQRRTGFETDQIRLQRAPSLVTGPWTGKGMNHRRLQRPTLGQITLNLCWAVLKRRYHFVLTPLKAPSCLSTNNTEDGKDKSLHKDKHGYFQKLFFE